MAGFPYHQLEAYLGKLIAAGLRVAICDQVEDPKLAKGLVKRELTRAEQRRHPDRRRPARPARASNYLAAVVPTVADHSAKMAAMRPRARRSAGL